MSSISEKPKSKTDDKETTQELSEKLKDVVVSDERKTEKKPNVFNTNLFAGFSGFTAPTNNRELPIQTKLLTKNFFSNDDSERTENTNTKSAFSFSLKESTKGETHSESDDDLPELEDREYEDDEEYEVDEDEDGDDDEEATFNEADWIPELLEATSDCKETMFELVDKASNGKRIKKTEFMATIKPLKALLTQFGRADDFEEIKELSAELAQAAIKKDADQLIDSLQEFESFLMWVSMTDEKRAQAVEEDEEDKVPVVIFAGPKRRGKTSIINNLLDQTEDLRFAVLQNEKGEVELESGKTFNSKMNEDAEFIAASKCHTLLNGEDGVSVIEEDDEDAENDEDKDDDDDDLGNFNVRKDLIEDLDEFSRDADEIDMMFIEAAENADPVSMVESLFANDEIDAAYKLGAFVTVLHAKEAMALFDASRVNGFEKTLAEQIAFSDVVVLNHSDSVSNDDIKTLTEAVRGINKFVNLVVAKDSKVDLDDIVSINAFDLKLVPESDFGTEEDVAQSLANENVDNGKLSTVVLQFPGTLDDQKLEDWINTVLKDRAEDIFRFRGVFSLTESDSKFVFAGSLNVFIGLPLEDWDDEERINKVVFIGRNLSAKELEETLKDCLEESE